MDYNLWSRNYIWKYLQSTLTLNWHFGLGIRCLVIFFFFPPGGLFPCVLIIWDYFSCHTLSSGVCWSGCPLQFEGVGTHTHETSAVLESRSDSSCGRACVPGSLPQWSPAPSPIPVSLGLSFFPLFSPISNDTCLHEVLSLSLWREADFFFFSFIFHTFF